MTQAQQPGGLAARRVAFRAVRRVHDRGAWSVPAVDAELRASDLDTRDRAFAANLAYEVLRWEGTLDWILAGFSTRPLEQLDPPVRDVLRVGCWQLVHGRAPARAVVDTAVELTRAEIGPHVTGFVNGVLRALVRQGQVRWPVASDAWGLGIRLGYPERIVAHAQERFGERARAVLEAGNAAPGVTLRAVLPGSRDALVAELEAQGLDAAPTPHAPEGVRAPGADPGRLAAVAEGRAVVQDEASMLVVDALLAALPADGEANQPPLVLDVCAAPGGKATHLAQAGAHVVAADRRCARAALVAGAGAALAHGGANLRVLAADGLRLPFRDSGLDAVLVDAPCTGLGTLRRRPELRWRRTPEEVATLATLQRALLTASLDLLHPGGHLLYSVCTWTRDETAEVVRQLLATDGDRVEAVHVAANGGVGTRLPRDPGLQLAGDLDGTDGMYLCLLRRR